MKESWLGCELVQYLQLVLCWTTVVHFHLVVDESGEMSLVTGELHHHELVTFISGKRKQKRVKLFKPLFHQVESFGWNDGRHGVLAPVVFGPQLSDLFCRLVR